MSEQPPSVSAEVHANLRLAAQLLRQPHHLGPEVQESLAEVVAELEHALESGTLSAEEMTHLHDSTAHLVEALRQHRDAGLLAAARDRLTRTYAAAEAQAPFAAGITRRLLDALASIGI
ncbi:MAG TPA: DUF4404 family protein [Gemmataceae bacterium]|nr:DUF4404 family protein [Gemmataceae bacterium]